MAATDATRSDASQHLLECLIDLLEETRDLVGSALAELPLERPATRESATD